jgi:PAS domain S-box-containing protein
MTGPTELADEVARLRACLNRLLSVAVLPALSTGREPTEIVGPLADALLGTLGLAFVLVRLNETGREQPIEFARIAESFHGTIRQRDISEATPTREALSRSLHSSVSLGGVDFAIASAQVGPGGEFGVVIAGSRNLDFPAQTERLLLDVAATAAVIAVRQERLLSQQRRAAAELDERALRRASELAAVNKRSEREVAEPRRWEDVESIPGMAATLTATGEVEFVNRRLLEYVGQTFDQVKEWASNGTVHPEDVERVVELNVRSIAAGTPFDFEVRSRRFDGVYRWLESRVYPLRDANGRIVRWYNLVIDIDERKRAEQAAAASERDLTLIINTIPSLAWSARPDGSADFFNQHYLEFVGLSAEQARGWGWTVAVHPDDLNDLAATWRRIVVSQAPGEAEARLRRHDGEYRWFLLRANPLRDETGAIVKWYAVNTDIADLKRAQEDLKRSESFLVEGQRLTRMGNFVWHLGTGDITWSEQLYRMFEFEPGTPVTLERIGSRVHLEDLPMMSDMIERAQRGESYFEYEHRLVMPDNSVKHLHLIAHAVPGDTDVPQYIGAVQDVTRRRLAEEALDKARSQLAHVSRVTTLSTLTASIAHEVNQPLSGIVTNADTCLFMLDTDPPNVDGARETVRRIIRDGNRAADVIARLRALFSKRAFTLEPVDPTEAALEVVALSLNDLQRNRVVLESELADDLPAVAGDRVQLQQVILNLLRNAVDAMIDVDDRPRRLLIRTEREGKDRVRLTVRDAGVGLDRQTMNKLFDAFYTTKSDGMGIGLSISRTIVEGHHGRLWVEANDGPGTTFVFWIPCLGENGPAVAGRDEDLLMGSD